MYKTQQKTPANTENNINDILNYRKLSEYLTGNPDAIRKNRIPKQFKKRLQELEYLLNYWKDNTITDK